MSNWRDPVMDGNPRDSSYASYMAPLVACLAASEGPVLECGIGIWSTPFLHRYCLAAGKRLVSIDEDPEWVSRFLYYNMAEHPLYYAVYDFVMPSLSRQQWGVVLMDQSPGERRAEDVGLFRNLDSAKYIIVHDYSGTEEGKPSMGELLEPVRKQWKNAVVAEFSPSTLVLSNSEIPWFPKARRLE